MNIFSEKNIKDHSYTVESFRSIRGNSRLENIKNSAKNIIPLTTSFIKDMTVCSAVSLGHGYVVSKIVNILVLTSDALLPLKIRDTEIFNYIQPKIIPFCAIVPTFFIVGINLFPSMRNAPIKQ